MSFGGSQGSVRYAVLVTDQATAPLQNINRQFTTFGQQMTTSVTKVNAFNSAINNNAKTFTASTTAIKTQGNALTSLQTNLKANTTQATGLGTSIKNTASKFAGLATGLSATASGALQLAAGFRDYNDAQIAVERVTRKLSLANEAVEKTGRKVVDLQKKGQTNTKAYTDAVRDHDQALSMQSIQTQLLGEAQERLFDSQTQFVTSVVPTVLGAFGSIGFAMKDLGGEKGISGLITKFKDFGGGIKTSVMSAITGLMGSGGLGGLTEKFKGAGTAAGGLKGNLLGLGVTGTVIGGVTIAALELAKAMNQVVSSLSHVQQPVSALEVATDKSGKSLQIYNQTFEETEAMARAGVAPIHILLDGIFGSKMTENILKNAGALDKNGKIIVDFGKKVQTIPPTMNAAAKSTDAWVNMMIKAIQSTDPKKIIEFNAAFKASGQSMDRYQQIVTEADAILKTFNQTTTDSIKSLNSQSTTVKQTVTIVGTLWKTWEVGGGKMATIIDGFGASVATLGKRFGELAAAQKDLFGTKFTQNVMQFTDLLKNWGGGKITQTIEQTNQKLKEHAGLVAQTNTGVKNLWQTWEKDAAGEVLKMDAKAIEDAKKKLDEFNKKVAAGVQAVGVTFKVKDNVEKFMKEIKKNLPNKIEKKIDMKLDFRGNVKDATTAFNNFLETATTMDEKTADGIVKGIIKTIDEQFKGKKGAFAGLRAQLEAEMKNPNTVQILKDNIANGDYTAAGKGVFSSVQAGIVAAANAGGGLASLWENSTGKGKGIVIPAPIIPKPITTDFDAGVKTLTTSVSNIAKTVPAISVNTKPANNSLTALIKRIDSIDNMKPAPKLNTKPANSSLSALIKRIDSIDNMKPAPKLNTGPANKTLSALINRIDSISNMHPTVHVKVVQDKIGAQHGFHGKLSGDTTIQAHAGEQVDIWPRGESERKGRSMSSNNNGGGGSVGGDTSIYINVMDETIMHKIQARQGRQRYTFGA